MSTQNTIVGVLAGVAIGAIAGVLLAPEKGEKTRKQLATKAKALKDDLTDEVEVAANKVSEKYEDLKTLCFYCFLTLVLAFILVVYYRLTIKDF